MTSAVPARIETARLVLRRLVATDADDLLEAVDTSRPELERWMRWPTRIGTLADAREVAADVTAEATSWERGIFRRDDDALIGGVDARVLSEAVPSFALAYWLRTSAVGNGYAREAVRALTGGLFDRLGARRVVVECDPGNRRSTWVAEACGFAFEARLRNEGVSPSGEVCDSLVYAMIDTDEAARALVANMREKG